MQWFSIILWESSIFSYSTYTAGRWPILYKVLKKASFLYQLVFNSAPALPFHYTDYPANLPRKFQPLKVIKQKFILWREIILCRHGTRQSSLYQQMTVQLFWMIDIWMYLKVSSQKILKYLFISSFFKNSLW